MAHLLSAAGAAGAPSAGAFSQATTARSAPRTRPGFIPRAGLEALTDPAGLLLPALGGAALAVAAARFAAYSQLEVVRTGMLGRHIKAGGARVLQLGGTTRDLFYLPKGTQQVTVAGADVRVSLWEQAGMQAGVPVRAVRTGNEEGQLGFMAGGSVDSVVAFDQLGAGAAAAAALLAEVWRVLKPGGTFVFVQRIDGSPVAALLRLGSGPAADPGVADVVGEAQPWDYMQWDLAVPSLDPHAVGVAVKPLAAAAPPGAGAGGAASVDKTAFEQVLRSKARTGAGPKAGKRKGFGGQ